MTGIENAAQIDGNARDHDGDHRGGVGDGADIRVIPGGNGSGDAGARVVRMTPVRLPAAPANEAAVLLTMIERAISDPAMAIDKVERMYALYERAAARSAKSAFLDALMRAKGEMPRMIRTGAASYKDKKTGEEQQAFRYAKWEEVCGQIEPVLAKNGLVLTFSSEQPGADRVNVTGILSHRDGHSERSQMALGCDASGGKNNAQGWGSAISYGKRYTAFALLNLVGHDDRDDDGRSAAAGATISDEQAEAIKAALETSGGSLPRFCAAWKLEKLTDMPASKFADAMRAIQDVAKRRQARD